MKRQVCKNYEIYFSKTHICKCKMLDTSAERTVFIIVVVKSIGNRSVRSIYKSTHFWKFHLLWLDESKKGNVSITTCVDGLNWEQKHLWWHLSILRIRLQGTISIGRWLKRSTGKDIICKKILNTILQYFINNEQLDICERYDQTIEPVRK